MDTKILGELGLTPAEVKTYLYLLTRPQTTATKIALETKLNRSNLYSILDNLIAKNLVSFIVIKKTRYYSANKPDSLKTIIDQKIDDFQRKKSELQELINNVDKISNLFGSELNIELYQGKEGIKRVLEEKVLKLKKGDTIYAFGYEHLFEREFGYYFRNVKNIRVEKGINFKALLKRPKVPQGSNRDLTNIKYVDLEFSSNVEIAFFENNVILFLISANPKALFIQNKEIYLHFLNYFNYIWNK